MAIARSISPANEGLLERDDETSHTGFLDLPKALARLNEVSLDAERDPVRDVTLRLMPGTVNALQHRAVLGGMRAEVLLD